MIHLHLEGAPAGVGAPPGPVLADARRAWAEIPDGVTASLSVWRAWAARLDAWADQDT
jgi:hypothetical protein